VAVTLAEPALSVVKTAGSLIQEDQAPYLYTLLHHRQELLVLAVAAGVGISASFGMLRIICNWSIKPVALGLSAFTLALSSYVNWWVWDLRLEIWKSGFRIKIRVSDPYFSAKKNARAKSRNHIPKP